MKTVSPPCHFLAVDGFISMQSELSSRPSDLAQNMYLMLILLTSNRTADKLLFCPLFRLQLFLFSKEWPSY